MFDFFASLFGYLMEFIYNLVQNYGIAIIVFTVLVKLALLPLSFKQQKSLEKSQKIQAKMQELQKQYKDDQETFVKEYQKMLKENNTSMMGSMGCSGCLLNLIQFPIILGMFYMLVSPLTHIWKIDNDEIMKYKEQVIETRKNEAIVQLQETSGDYLTETALNEEIQKIKDADDSRYIDPRYYEIEIIKEGIIEDNDINLDFFGINLGEAASKNKGNYALLIIPILSGLFTALTVIINNLINKKKGIVQPKPEDMEVPMPDMRVLNIMLPIMLFSIAYSIPQGVGLYWVTSNLIGVIQVIIQRVILDPDRKVKSLTDGENESKIEYEIIEEDGTKTQKSGAIIENTKNKNNNKNDNKNKKGNKKKKK